MSGPQPATPAVKRLLRAELLRARRASPPTGQAAAQVVPLVAGRRLVASYLSLVGEPLTDGLHAACWAAAVRVAVPRLLPGGDLELVELRPGARLVDGLRGTRAPEGPALPWDAADLVVVPALAVDRCGTRLGRGGGSYDRALAGAPTGIPVVALLARDDELRDELPREPHDVPVTAAATPTRLVPLEGDGRGSPAARSAL